MINQNQKQALLKEILKSNSFINSKLNSKLLTYLVECEIEDKAPSEYSIAIDVFNKDSSFNPNEDTIIRVSVYNLRKKLERYYQNMGKRTKLRVKIPKGHYEVNFFNYSRENFTSRLKNPYTILISVIFLLLTGIIYLLSLSNKVAQSANNEIFHSMYNDIISSSNLKIITLGDDFIYFSDFSEFKTTPIRRMIRNSAINTEAEFEEFKSQSEDRIHLNKLPFSFFNQASVWPLPKIAILLNSLNLTYSLKSSTNLRSNDIKNSDVIFIGSFWTLGILNQFLKDENIEYNIIGEESFTLNSITGDSSISFTRNGVPAYDHDDYCLFMRLPGPNNNTIYFIISFYATGSMGAVSFLTEEKSLLELENKLKDKFKSVPDYFKLVFKSKGYHREVLSTEIIHIEKINNDKNIE